MTQPPDLPNRLLFFFYALFVFASTFSIALAQMALGIATLLFLITAIREKYNPLAGGLGQIYLVVGLFVGWLLLASAIGRTPLQSLAMCREEWLFGAMLIGVYIFQRDERREKLITWLAVGVGLLSLYTFVQYATGTHWLHLEHGWFVPEPVVWVKGNFTHYLTFANYYAVASMSLFGYALFSSRSDKRRRYAMLAVAVLAMIATVLTSSRTPIVAIIVALIWCAIVRAGRYRVGIAAVIVLVSVIAVLQPGVRDKFGNSLGRDIGTEYEGSRLFIWQRSLDIVAKHPVFGVGQGNFREEYVARLRPDIPEGRKHAHAHNDVLNIAAISGIPGALFFIAMWAMILSRVGKAAFSTRLTGGMRGLAYASLVGSIVFLICSMTEAAFADEEVRQLLMFLWAPGLVAWSEYRARGVVS